jgi:MSHA biogenesis protein MshL
MKSPTASRILGAGLISLGLLSCAQMTPQPPPPSAGHLTAQAPVQGASIPPVVAQAAYVPPPQPVPETEHYTVVVNDVPVRELLFALARDAKMNVDIAGDIGGNVTLNAVEQTLPQILDRVARQTNLRYRIEGSSILIEPDTPFFRTYDVGYVNLARDADSTVSVATQVATTGEGGAENTSGGAGQSRGRSDNANSSLTRVNTRSSNRFWETLTDNVLGIIGEAPTSGQGKAHSDNLLVNAESGVISVKATTAQHREIQEFLDRVLLNARRQVLVEATIVEVTLGDQYQAGVDWKIVLGEDQAGIGVNQSLLGGVTDGIIDSAVSSFVLGYRDPDASGKLVEAKVRLLREFGDTKVLSSPRLMVMNNQTALLKVVEELVYFTLDVTSTDSTMNAQGRTYVESNVHSVPVGLVMAVTPQISANQEVTLTVRPTISQKIGEAIDPGPQLASEINGSTNSNITNTVPVIRTREMESVLKLVNGQVGVLGGLMQDEIKKDSRQVPGAARLPLIGDLLFNTKEAKYQKTELVIFLRPVIVGEPNVAGELKDYAHYLGNAPAGKEVR